MKLKVKLTPNGKVLVMKPEGKKVTKPGSVVLTADVSGSMGGELKRLERALAETVDMLPQEATTTLVSFAGEDYQKLWYKLSTANPQTKQLIVEATRTTHGTTCFSKPLNLILTQVAPDMQALGIAGAVILFSDGCPVVSWSVEKERQLVLEIGKKLAGMGFITSAAGFGGYYDEKTLRGFASCHPLGQFVHCNELERLSIFGKEAYDSVEVQSGESVQVRLEVGGVWVTKDELKYLPAGSYEIPLADGANRLFVAEGEVEIDGQKIEGAFPSAGRGADAEPWIWGAGLYLAGNTQSSLDWIAKAGDKRLVDQISRAFTTPEKADVADELKKAALKKKYRMVEGKIPDGYLPSEDGYNFFEFLKDCQDGVAFYAPDLGDKYQSVHMDAKDRESNRFHKYDEIALWPVSAGSIVLNGDRCNVSITGTRRGWVALDPEGANAVGLPDRIENISTFSSHVLILDGYMHLGKKVFFFDAETLAKIESKAYPGFVVSKEPAGRLPIQTVRLYQVELDFSKLPAINRQMIRSCDLKELARLQIELSSIKARAKAVNSVLKGAEVEGALTNDFTPEQESFLKSQGVIAKRNAYEVPTVKVEPDKGDPYTVRKLSVYIPGSKTLPSLKDSLARYVKAEQAGRLSELKPEVTLMAEELFDLCTLTNLDWMNLSEIPAEAYKTFDERGKWLRRKARDIETRLFALRMAFILGGFSEGLETKDGGVSQFSVDGQTVEVKFELKTEYR